MRVSTLIPCWGILLLAPSLARAEPPSPEGVEFFEKKIRPVLVERCFKCHSSEAPKLKGGFKLDSREGLLKGGDSGPAIAPGDPGKGLLLKALGYTGMDVPPMPPDGKLSEAQIADFTEWVKMGAPDPRDAAAAAPQGAAEAPAPAKPKVNYEEGRKFWSFQPVGDPAPPEVKRAAWVRTPVDRFILAKLEAAGIEPAPQADKRTLIRRATFDLIGLPPKPEEIDAFLADSSADAFSKVVDRLLASPQYGERWGRHWLDVVRYADSFDARAGIEQDIFESFRYRDWVVGAFNKDMPYDQFLLNQIAGDLMPPPGGSEGGFNAEGTIATGVLAIGNWPGGDADKQKMVSDIVDDQVDLVSRGMMGLTVGCARCHDHKFDPIATEDYYAMAGIFFSSHILPGPGKKTEGSPVLKIPLLSPEEMAAREKRSARIKELETQVRRVSDVRSRAIAKNLLPSLSRAMLTAWDYHNQSEASRGLTLDQFAARSGFDPEVLRSWIDYLGWGDGRLLNVPVRTVAGKPEVLGFKGPGDLPSLVANTSEKEIAFATIVLPPKTIAVHPAPGAAVGMAWHSPIGGKFKIAGRVADADDKGGDGIAWTLTLRPRAGDAKVLAKGEIQNGEIQAFDAVPDGAALASVTIEAGDSIELAILPKANHTCDTTAIQIELHELGGEERNWSLTWDLIRDLHEGGKGNPHSDSYGNPSVWYALDLGETKPAEPKPGSLLALWRNEIGKLALAGSAGNDARALAQRAAERIQGSIEHADAAKEGEKPLAALREELLSGASPFWPSTPLRAELGSNLARTMTASMNAELAELRKNEPPAIQYAVGVQEGGVPDTEHAGIHDVQVHVRGSYARLGDLVARGFPKVAAGDTSPHIERGSGRIELGRWVSSKENPLTARVMVNRIWQHHFGEGIVRTPGNFGKLGERPTHPELLDFLARRFMESGWSVKAMHRAIMLSAAYRQSSEAAESARQADPDNLLFCRMNRRRLESEAIRDSLLAAAGKLDPTMGGTAIADLNAPRRTLYIKTVRSDRATYGALFDAADPTAITDKRAESTVAPQALFLMNNPFVADRVKELAARAMALDRPSDVERIDWLYQTLYGRPATPREVEIGTRMLGQAAETKDKAWEAYAQILVCANEFIYVD